VNEHGAVVPVPHVFETGGVPNRKPVLLIASHPPFAAATLEGFVVNEYARGGVPPRGEIRREKNRPTDADKMVAPATLFKGHVKTTLRTTRGQVF